jgi:hypothetical protein
MSRLVARLRHNHVSRELADLHRLAERGVHFGVGIAHRIDPVRRIVGGAQEAVAYVHPRVRLQQALVDGGKHSEQHWHLDRAGGVKPALRVVAPTGAVQVVVVGNGDVFGAGFCANIDNLPAQIASAGGRNFVDRNSSLRHRRPAECASRVPNLWPEHGVLLPLSASNFERRLG